MHFKQRVLLAEVTIYRHPPCIVEHINCVLGVDGKFTISFPVWHYRDMPSLILFLSIVPEVKCFAYVPFCKYLWYNILYNEDVYISIY